MRYRIAGAGAGGRRGASRWSDATARQADRPPRARDGASAAAPSVGRSRATRPRRSGRRARRPPARRPRATPSRASRSRATTRSSRRLLPNELCGAKVVEVQLHGRTSSPTDADPEFAAMLARRSARRTDDVSLAVAGVVTADDPCSRRDLPDQGRRPEQAQGGLPRRNGEGGARRSRRSRSAGKTVLYDKDSDSFQYAYFKDDAVIFFVASDDQRAAEILAALP